MLPTNSNSTPALPQGFELAQAVADVLASKIASGATFTAWDITQELRGVYTTEVILHNAVRTLVHQDMAVILASGGYQGSLTDINGSQVITYHP